MTGTVTSLKPTSILAEFVSGLRYEDLPERAREHSRDLLFDAIGNALAGHIVEQSTQIEGLARRLGESQESTVIGGEPRSMAGATVLNGYLISANTAMDVYHPAICHVTPEVVPPALAVAEQDELDGKRLLTAVAAGFEVTVRVCVGLDFPTFRPLGWHSPGIAGPFGGAAAVGKLLGLDATRQRNALGLAGSQAAGTYASRGTPTLKFHQARGALSGLMGGLLAEQGFGASEEILNHQDGGIFKAYSDGGRPEAAVADLGRQWELEQISIRPWPSSPSAMLTGLLDLIQRHDLQAEQLERVRVFVDPELHKINASFAAPQGRFHALLSLHYVTSVVLHDRVVWLDQFGPERYTDPAVLAFARDRVEVVADPDLLPTSVRLEMRTRDGRELTGRVDAARGTPTNPASREELSSKFLQSAKSRISSERAERALEMLLNLEQVGNVRELTELLRLR